MKEFSIESAVSEAKIADLAYKPEEEIRDKIRPFGFELFHYMDIEHTDTQAFIAESPRNILIALPGTDSDEDIFTDLNIILSPFPETRWPICRPKVHSGFLNAFKSIETILYQKIEEIMQVNPNISEFTIVGHSLGGGIGALAAFSLKKRYKIPTYFTGFALPRIGNRHFVRRFNRTVDKAHIVAIDKDLVPKLPPKALGYRHFKNYVLLNDEKEIIINPKGFDKLEETLEAVATFFENESVRNHTINTYISALEKLQQSQKEEF